MCASSGVFREEIGAVEVPELNSQLETIRWQVKWAKADGYKVKRHSGLNR